MKFKRAYIKEDFSKTTEQGYEVVEIATSRSGRKYAIIHRPKTNDYLIAAGYNTDRGDWGQGYYDYKTLEDARNALDMAMERAGDTRYLHMESMKESSGGLTKGQRVLYDGKEAEVYDWDRGTFSTMVKIRFLDTGKYKWVTEGSFKPVEIKEGMKDTLDKMIKEESLNEEAGEDTLARKAVELSNEIFTFLYRYYTKENDSVITPDDKKAILKAQSAFDDIAERADSDLRIIRNDSEASLKNNEKQTYVDDVERVDTRKMSIIRGDDDIGVDEYDIVRK